jgi:sporulation protein YlmC with PRC-barrel domain
MDETPPLGEKLPIEETDRLIASDMVEGTKVFDVQGHKLGVIKNFMVDKATGKVEYVVMVFGGVLGFDREFYPMPWSMLTYDSQHRRFVTELTEEALENAPRYREDPPTFDHVLGREIHGYYGLDYP